MHSKQIIVAITLFTLLILNFATEINIILEHDQTSSAKYKKNLIKHEFRSNQNEGRTLWLTFNNTITKIDGFIDSNLEDVDLGIPSNYLKFSKNGNPVKKIFFGQSDDLSEIALCSESTGAITHEKEVIKALEVIITNEISNKMLNEYFKVQENYLYPRQKTKKEDNFTCIGYINPLGSSKLINPIALTAFSFIKPFLDLSINDDSSKLGWLKNCPFWIELTIGDDEDIARIDFSIDLIDKNQKQIGMNKMLYYGQQPHININHHYIDKIILDQIQVTSNEKILYNHNKTHQLSYEDHYIELITTLKGEGLHQHIIKKIKPSSDKSFDDQCNIILIEYISEDTYIDLDEIIQLNEFEFYTFDVLDIERPSTHSKQHIALIKMPLKQLVNGIKYPFHFRYQNPGVKEYVDSKYFVNTQIYYSCSNKQNKILNDVLEIGSFDSYLISKLFGSQYKKALVNYSAIDKQGKMHHNEVMINEVAIGKKPLQDIVMFITLLVTVISTGIILNSMRKHKSI